MNGPGSEFNGDFRNDSPLVVARFASNVNPVLAARFFTGPKLNMKGLLFTYEKPFIDGPLIP